jgi:hypothetical protein
MKAEHLYAIVNARGECWTIVDRGTEKSALPDLLANGWRPVRETTFAQATGEGYILICLEREPEGQAGFGFGH